MAGKIAQTLWINEPAFITGSDFNQLLELMSEARASDVTVRTGLPVMVKIHGAFHQATQRCISAAESMEILGWIFKSERAYAQICGGAPLDFAYSAKTRSGKSLRFRANATSCDYKGGAGLHLTLRLIDSTPPLPEDIGMEAELLSTFSRARGLVVVSGPTGSGKSTLLAVAARWMIERESRGFKLVTVEHPIEFLLEEIFTSTSFAVQTEVGRNVQSFEQGAINALRQNADAALIGECREPSTVNVCLELAREGHAVWTTAHATGVPESIARLIRIHPVSEQESKAQELANCLSLLISQKLVPSVNGQRVALREFVEIDKYARERLSEGGAQGMAGVARQILARQGQSFAAAANEALRNGLITKAVAAEVIRDEL